MFNILYNLFIVQDINSGVSFFWSTPLGASAVFIILLCAFFKIFRGNLDFITSMYNWVLVLVCSISMLHIIENTNPRHQMMTIILALAVKKSWDVYKIIFKKGIN